MELLNAAICLPTIIILLFVVYRLGILKGRKTADQILGIEHRKAMNRSKQSTP